MAEDIRTDQANLIANPHRGAVMMPDYKERRGVTYAVGETDLMIIASFTAEASRLYSIAGFFLGSLMNILINYGTSESLTPVAGFLLYRASWALGIGAVVFFVWGLIITGNKNDVVDQIRRECGVTPKKRISTVVSGWSKAVLDKLSPSENVHS